MLETLRMVVTLSKTSACAPLRLVLWVHSYSGHIICLTYCLFTLSMRNSLKPVLKVLHTTSNVRATANSWYVLPLFLSCWDQSNSNILSPQDQASKWKLCLERWTTCRTSRKCTLISISMLIYFNFDFIQIQLRPANGSPTERWVFTRVDNGYEDDERWELLQRIGRFLGQIRVWGFFAVWSP